jgi:hypothetical protein
MNVGYFRISITEGMVYYFAPEILLGQVYLEPALLATCSMLVSCLAHSSHLEIEATYSFETSVDIQSTKPPYIPEDITLHNHSCENLESCKNFFV